MSLVDPMAKIQQDMDYAKSQHEFCNHLARNDPNFNHFWKNHHSYSNYDLVLLDYSKMYPAKPVVRARRATIIYDDEEDYPDTVVYDGTKKVYGGLSGKKVNAVQIANKTIMLPSDEDIQKAYGMNQSTNPDKSYTSYDREKTQIINQMIPLVKELDDLSQQYESLQKRNEYGQNVLDWERVKTAFPPSAPLYEETKSTDRPYKSSSGGFRLGEMGRSSVPPTRFHSVPPTKFHSATNSIDSSSRKLMESSLDF